MARTFEGVVPQMVGLADLGTFVDEAGKDRLVAKGTPLALRRVVFDELNRYGPRWIVSASDLTTGEVVAIGMPANPTRDRQFAALSDALGADDAEPIDPVVLIRVGKKDAMTFRSATSAEIEAAVTPPTVESPSPARLAKLPK